MREFMVSAATINVSPAPWVFSIYNLVVLVAMIVYTCHCLGDDDQTTVACMMLGALFFAAFNIARFATMMVLL